jgi:hypothetical protein
MSFSHFKIRGKRILIENKCKRFAESGEYLGRIQQKTTSGKQILVLHQQK